MALFNNEESIHIHRDLMYSDATRRVRLAL